MHPSNVMNEVEMYELDLKVQTKNLSLRPTCLSTERANDLLNGTMNIGLIILYIYVCLANKTLQSCSHNGISILQRKKIFSSPTVFEKSNSRFINSHCEIFAMTSTDFKMGNFRLSPFSFDLSKFAVWTFIQAIRMITISIGMFLKFYP